MRTRLRRSGGVPQPSWLPADASAAGAAVAPDPFPALRGLPRALPRPRRPRRRRRRRFRSPAPARPGRPRGGLRCNGGALRPASPRAPRPRHPRPRRPAPRPPRRWARPRRARAARLGSARSSRVAVALHPATARLLGAAGGLLEEGGVELEQLERHHPDAAVGLEELLRQPVPGPDVDRRAVERLRPRLAPEVAGGDEQGRVRRVVLEVPAAVLDDSGGPPARCPGGRGSPSAARGSRPCGAR